MHFENRAIYVPHKLGFKSFLTPIFIARAYLCRIYAETKLVAAELLLPRTISAMDKAQNEMRKLMAGMIKPRRMHR